MKRDVLRGKVMGCAIGVHRFPGARGLLIDFDVEVLKNGIKRFKL
jgi:hypothetical protein